MRGHIGRTQNMSMFRVASLDNLEVLAVSASTARNRFTSLVALAEQKLLAGERGSDVAAIVGELREMAATSDEANDAMCESDDLAIRFDSVVAAWKELSA